MWIQIVEKPFQVTLEIMSFHRKTPLQGLLCKLMLNISRSDQPICSGTEGFILYFNSSVAISTKTKLIPFLNSTCGVVGVYKSQFIIVYSSGLDDHCRSLSNEIVSSVLHEWGTVDLCPESWKHILDVIKSL